MQPTGQRGPRAARALVLGRASLLLDLSGAGGGPREGDLGRPCGVALDRTSRLGWEKRRKDRPSAFVREPRAAPGGASSTRRSEPPGRARAPAQARNLKLEQEQEKNQIFIRSAGYSSH